MRSSFKTSFSHHVKARVEHAANCMCYQMMSFCIVSPIHLPIDTCKSAPSRSVHGIWRPAIQISITYIYNLHVLCFDRKWRCYFTLFPICPHAPSSHVLLLPQRCLLPEGLLTTCLPRRRPVPISSSSTYIQHPPRHLTRPQHRHFLVASSTETILSQKQQKK
jgi:hypothetical protein